MTMTQPSLTQTLLQQAARWREAGGGDLGPAQDTDREHAAHAVNGELLWTKESRWIPVGRSAVDWQADHVPHHVWRSYPQRFMWLSHLSSTYRSDADEAVAAAARDYIADYMVQHPVDAAGAWSMARYDNGLNLAIRLQNWLRALAVFTPSPAWDDSFRLQVITSIAGQLDFIRAQLSPKGNFRIVQGMALLEAATRLAQLGERADRWRRDGLRILNDAARRQVLPDGAHVECTPTYHGWMTRVFRECLDLGLALPELTFTFRPERIAAMWDYSVATVKPNGSLCGICDSEGIYAGTQVDDTATQRAAFRARHHLPVSEPPLQQVFPHARQAFLRDAPGADAAYLTFDATRWGSAHAHLSRLGLQFHSHGRSFVIDPGRMEYEMGNPLGPYGKSTRAHSTLNLNGWNQSNTNVDRFAAWSAPGYDCLTATYSGGYWNAPFGWWFSAGFGHGIRAVHTRSVFWVHGRFVAVIDELTRWQEKAHLDPSHTAPTLELNWQFAPGELSVDADACQARTHFADANLLLLTPLRPPNARMSLHCGETDPYLGWARDPGRYAGAPAPLVALRCAPETQFMATLVTVLIPFAGTAAPAVRAEAQAPGLNQDVAPGRLRLHWPDGSADQLAWKPGLEVAVGEDGDAATDASLLYRHHDGRVWTCAAIADGTWCDAAASTLSILTPNPE